MATVGLAALHQYRPLTAVVSFVIALLAMVAPLSAQAPGVVDVLPASGPCANTITIRTSGLRPGVLYLVALESSRTNLAELTRGIPNDDGQLTKRTGGWRGSEGVVSRTEAI